MRPTDTHSELRTMVQVLRILVGCMALGLAAFLGLGTWWHEGPITRAVPESASFFTYVAVALGATQPIVFALTRMALVGEAVRAFRAEDVAPFRTKYMAAVIVGAAGIEAGGLLSAVAYFLEGRIAALGAGALCVLCLLLSLPSRRGVDSLIDSRP